MGSNPTQKKYQPQYLFSGLVAFKEHQKRFASPVGPQDSDSEGNPDTGKMSKILSNFAGL